MSAVTNKRRNPISRESSRSSPYQRPTANPPGDSDSPWKHDLFNPLSNLYNPDPKPIANSRHVPSPLPPSASLRPFGSYTPTSAISEPQPSPPKEQRPPTLFERIGIANIQNSASLASRLGSNGVAAVQAPTKPAVAAQRQDKRQARQIPQQPKYESRMKADAIEFDNEPPKTSRGIKVKVTNLVPGTTPEDVKTAFNTFGTIINCYVTSGERGLLVAEIYFESETAARAAVDQLDGALADDQVLSVSIERLAVPKAVVSRRVVDKSNQDGPANLFARMGGGNGQPLKQSGAGSQKDRVRPRSQQQQQQQASQPVASIPAEPSRMRSDIIAGLDPRTSTQTMPSYVVETLPPAERRYVSQSTVQRDEPSHRQQDRSRLRGRDRDRDRQSRPTNRGDRPAAKSSLAARLGLATGSTAMDMS